MGVMAFGSCAECEGERDVPCCCDMCGAMVCDTCVCVCSHHGCGAVVCLGCFNPLINTCNACANRVCELCDEWVDYVVEMCACCGRSWCSRCVQVFFCEACGCPACTDCGSFLIDTTQWLCCGCTYAEKVYTENLVLNAHGLSNVFTVQTL